MTRRCSRIHLEAPSFQRAFDEMFADDGTVRTPYKRIFGALASADEFDLGAGPRGRARCGVHRPGHHLLPRGARAALPAGPGAARDRRRRVEPRPRRDQAAARCWRCSSTTSTPSRRSCTTASSPSGWAPCAHFHRQAAGIRPPNGVRIHVAGIDLIRDAEGTFRGRLEDNQGSRRV